MPRTEQETHDFNAILTALRDVPVVRPVAGLPRVTLMFSEKCAVAEALYPLIAAARADGAAAMLGEMLGREPDVVHSDREVAVPPVREVLDSETDDQHVPPAMGRDVTQVLRPVQVDPTHTDRGTDQ